MTQRKTERERWVTVLTLYAPTDSAETSATKRCGFDELHAVAVAFEKVGRVLRVEPAPFTNALFFKARKA